ncbi:MAG: HEAT repeat domain-containing protein, partial [Candidatus Hydrogenedentota bacterium]
EAEASYKKRVTIEPLLFGVLRSGSQSGEAKEFIGQQLYRIVDEDSVAELTKLLYRRGTGDIARRGLEIIDHSDAHDALMDALRKVTGSTLTGVIESLGRRRNAEAVRPLRGFVQSGNSAVVEASLIALGEIGGADAAQLLGMSRLNVRRSLRSAATRAYMRCGWTSLGDGDSETALTVFDSLLIDVGPPEIREEALRGYVETEGEYSIPTIIEVLRSDEPRMQTVAAEAASGIPGVEATLALVDTFTDLTPPIQLLVVRILGERRDIAGMPTVIQSVSNRDPSVRLESLRAIAKFNHPDTLHVLLKVSATGSAVEKEMARATLEALEGEKINEALVKSAMSADNAIRLEAVKMMPIRKATRGVAVLVRIAERDIKEIQFEALVALGVLGTQEELELMVGAWSGQWSEARRAAIGEGIVAIATRSPAGVKRVNALHAALRSAPDSEVQLSIIRALAEIQDDASISALRSVVRSAPESVQSEVIRVFIEWPSAEVLPDLERLARTSDEASVRDEAFAGFVELLGETADHGSSSTVRVYQRAVKMAETTEKRRMLLPGVGRLTSSSAGRIWDTLAKDPALAEEVSAMRAN